MSSLSDSIRIAGKAALLHAASDRVRQGLYKVKNPTYAGSQEGKGRGG
jgi:hypothetical protein